MTLAVCRQIREYAHYNNCPMGGRGAQLGCNKWAVVPVFLWLHRVRTGRDRSSTGRHSVPRRSGTTAEAGICRCFDPPILLWHGAQLGRSRTPLAWSAPMCACAGVVGMRRRRVRWAARSIGRSGAVRPVPDPTRAQPFCNLRL